MADAEKELTEQGNLAQAEVFHIHSLVRDVSTRLERAKSPVRHRFKQLLGGGLVRLVRKRPTAISKATLLKLINELKSKEAEGILKVTLPSGERVDLSTLQPIEKAKAEEPKPHPPLDSAANDVTFEHGVGMPIPQNPGGVSQMANPPLPKAAQGMPDGDAGPEPKSETTAAKVLCDTKTKPEMQKLLEEFGLDSSGNKMDLAIRLVRAGYEG